MADITIDAITELVYKSGPALRFNVMYHADFNTDNHDFFAVPGFRWMDGCIHPPTVRQGGSWNPTLFLGKTSAALVYIALEYELKKLGLFEKYPLAPRDIAIEGLISSKVVCRFFPGTWK